MRPMSMRLDWLGAPKWLSGADMGAGPMTSASTSDSVRWFAAVARVAAGVVRAGAVSPAVRRVGARTARRSRLGASPRSGGPRRGGRAQRGDAADRDARPVVRPGDGRLHVLRRRAGPRSSRRSRLGPDGSPRPLTDHRDVEDDVPGAVEPRPTRAGDQGRRGRRARLDRHRVRSGRSAGGRRTGGHAAAPARRAGRPARSVDGRARGGRRVRPREVVHGGRRVGAHAAGDRRRRRRASPSAAQRGRVGARDRRLRRRRRPPAARRREATQRHRARCRRGGRVPRSGTRRPRQGRHRPDRSRTPRAGRGCRSGARPHPLRRATGRVASTATRS